MEYLAPISATWWNLLVLALALTGVYLGLGFLERLLDLSNTFRYFRGPVRESLRIARILFEPVAAFLLAFVFALINHVEHGALLILVIIVSFPHLRNYVSGRLLMLENSLQVGDEIDVGSIKGKVQQLGRLGLKLRNPGGLHHLNYQKLFSVGYARTSSANTGEYVTLEISPESTKTGNNDKQRIATVLASAPYVDWHLPPSLVKIGEQEDNFRARVQLKKEAHLKDLVALLKEKGYLSNVLHGHFED